jgi:alpha-1,3-rhamnosyltransferase
MLESGPPLVSIIIPSFNHRPYVEEGIRAALAQTYTNCEVIVVDDASTDGSGDFLEELAAQLPIRLIRNPNNVGLNKTLQNGLKAAVGTYISMIASDDKVSADKIEWQVDFLTTTGLDGIYGTGWLLKDDSQLELMDLKDFEEYFSDGSALRRLYVDDTRGPLLQAALLRSEVIKEVWAHRGTFKSDDWLTLIRLLERYRIGFVNRPCFYYRQHEGNSHRNYWQTLPMRMEIVANVTPETLRPLATANIFFSHGVYLAAEGKLSSAFKFTAAAIALDPSVMRLRKTVLLSTRYFARALLRLFK